MLIIVIRIIIIIQANFFHRRGENIQRNKQNKTNEFSNPNLPCRISNLALLGEIGKILCSLEKNIRNSQRESESVRESEEAKHKQKHCEKMFLLQTQ